jgi:4-hydroxy-3-polyprenylbenzoate decarboxylase
MTGATGAILGIRLLQFLQPRPDIEVHLVLSRWARTTIQYETSLSTNQVKELADVSYSWDDQGAAISSGSYPTDGTVIIPCSMKTLAAIRTGYADGLIARTADVALKKRRKLVLVPRESPLNDIHLENMLTLSRMGAVIVPPMPAFYTHPESVDHLVGRVLDQFGIQIPKATRWSGMRRSAVEYAPTAQVGEQ